MGIRVSQRVSKQQIEQAKKIDLLTYLQTFEPQELVKVGHGEYKTRTHDSLKVSENGKWNWCSHGFGGTTALNYLIRVQQMDFVSAVRMLCETESVSFVQHVKTEALPPEQEQRPFTQPLPDKGTEAVAAYLHGREIRSRVTRFCIREGLLYQTTRGGYKNCVFVGKDETGQPKSASMRGCQGKFRGDATGSQKQYGFCIPAEQPDSPTVEVYEAPIDAMSGASFRVLKDRSSWRPVHYLALGGLNYRALDAFLDAHPEVKNIRLCLDNDEPGRTFSAKLMERYQKKGYKMQDCPPRAGKDYNDALIHYSLNLSRKAIEK